jgi:hypothetical protein
MQSQILPVKFALAGKRLRKTSDGRIIKIRYISPSHAKKQFFLFVNIGDGNSRK